MIFLDPRTYWYGGMVWYTHFFIGNSIFHLSLDPCSMGTTIGFHDHILGDVSQDVLC